MKPKPLTTFVGPYTRAVAAAVADAAVTGVWTAAGALPSGRRRIVRAGVLAATAAAVAVPGAAPGQWWDGAATQKPPARLTRLQVVALGTGLGVSVALRVGGRRLERRWLAALARNGHVHPHRAVAVRMAALSLAGSLPSRLFEAHATSRASQCSGG